MLFGTEDADQVLLRGLANTNKYNIVTIKTLSRNLTFGSIPGFDVFVGMEDVKSMDEVRQTVPYVAYLSS